MHLSRPHSSTRPRAAVLAIALAALVAPSTRADAQGTGAVAGTITAAGTSQPIPDVRVAATGTQRAATTDAQGRYRITGLPGGAYTVTATRAGFEPGSRSVTVEAGQTATADFALTLGSVLLPGVVVSAARAPEPAQQTAATVNVMSREQVRASPARTTDDLLREMPGVELPRTSSTVSGPEEIVSIRGADEGRTLVLLDGVPLNDPWGEWIQWNRAPRFDIDRAEVLEGGGSSLYGNYAMGGVISLFSRPIEQRGYELMASGGSRDAFDASAFGSDVHGPVGYSLNADWGSGGGYTLLRPDQRGPIDQPSHVTRRNVNGRVEYALGTGSTLFARANYFWDDRSLGTPLTEPNQRDITSGTLGGDFASVLGGRLQARLYGQVQHYDSRSSIVNAQRTSEIPNVAQSIPSHDVGGSLIWSRPLGIFQVLSAGGDFRYMHGALDEDVFRNGAQIGTRSSGGSQQVGGVFVQGVLAPIEPLRIEASARVDAWRSYDGHRIDATAATPADTTYASKSNAAFAPRLGVRYEVLKTLTLRGSFYQAFRAPTLSEQYRTFFAGPNTFEGNPALTPEYLTGFDGGFDWRPAKVVELRATAFYNRYKDLDNFEFRAPNPVTGGIFLQRQNQGKARSQGVEAEVAIRPVDALTLMASYNYDDARVIDHDTTAQYINRVPLQRFTARAMFDSPRIATFNVIWRHEGPNHTLSGQRLDPFSVLDLSAQRTVYRNVGAFLSVENVFDQDYTVNFTGPLEYIGLPRTVRAGATLTSF